MGDEKEERGIPLCARTVKQLSMQILSFDSSRFEFCLASPMISSVTLS